MSEVNDSNTIQDEGVTPADGETSSSSSLLGVDASKNAGDKNSEGGDKPDEQGDDPKKGIEKTDQGSEALTITAPEGLEEYQGDFDAFASDMDNWIKENPDATIQSALAEAARRQAALVSSKKNDGVAAFNDQVDAWEKEAMADSEIGGDKYQENLAQAVRAIEAFGSDALKKALDESGLGSHPEMIRFAMKAGAQLKEAPVLKGARASSGMSLEEALYGKNP